MCGIPPHFCTFLPPLTTIGTTTLDLADDIVHDLRAVLLGIALVDGERVRGRAVVAEVVAPVAVRDHLVGHGEAGRVVEAREELLVPGRARVAPWMSARDL